MTSFQTVLGGSEQYSALSSAEPLPAPRALTELHHTPTTTTARAHTRSDAPELTAHNAESPVSQATSQLSAAAGVTATHTQMLPLSTRSALPTIAQSPPTQPVAALSAAATTSQRSGSPEPAEPEPSPPRTGNHSHSPYSLLSEQL